MAEAFECDLCECLEAGKPAQKITIAPALGGSHAVEMCSGCLAEFNDWRDARKPTPDDPERYA